MRRETHYEVLGVPRRATLDQVERAHHFLLEMYDDASLATYSLLDAEEVRDARSRISQAYDVLRDPMRRQAYDATLEAAEREGAVLAFTPTIPVPVTPPLAGAPQPEPPLAVSVLNEPVTGEHLRRFREQKGINLQDIASASKIGMRFLEYIEADRHGELPARVYLRSFLLEYARALGLDPRRTAEAYMARLPKDR
jgi:curved DNA-binding protein CbpA